MGLSLSSAPKKQLSGSHKFHLTIKENKFQHRTLVLHIGFWFLISQIVNPAKVKETVIHQLKNQIGDLERFITFLQGEVTSPGPFSAEECTCPLHSKVRQDVSNSLSLSLSAPHSHPPVKVLVRSTVLLTVWERSNTYFYHFRVYTPLSSAQFC